MWFVCVCVCVCMSVCVCVCMSVWHILSGNRFTVPLLQLHNRVAAAPRLNCCAINADTILADCPAVSLDLCIYTAGGGNPLYQGELFKQCSNVKNKSIGLIFFAELESYMHKVDVEANK